MVIIKRVNPSFQNYSYLLSCRCWSFFVVQDSSSTFKPWLLVSVCSCGYRLLLVFCSTSLTTISILLYLLGMTSMVQQSYKVTFLWTLAIIISSNLLGLLSQFQTKERQACQKLSHTKFAQCSRGETHFGEFRIDLVQLSWSNVWVFQSHLLSYLVFHSKNKHS